MGQRVSKRKTKITECRTYAPDNPIEVEPGSIATPTSEPGSCTYFPRNSNQPAFYHATRTFLGILPTTLGLMAMKGANGKSLRVIETIAAGNYKMFGMYLLQDMNGLTVDLIEKNHIIKGAESITQAILQKWLTSDAPTRTYQHLIECLKQSKLGALAELIACTLANITEGMPSLHVHNMIDDA